MDASTADGRSPMDVAKVIMHAVINKKSEVITCSLLPRMVYWLRFVCPPLYFLAMGQRASSQKQKL